MALRLGGRTRVRSAPVIRPVTPVFPPKNSLTTGITRTSPRSSPASSGVARVPELARQDPDRRRASRAERDGRGRVACPQPRVGGGVRWEGIFDRAVDGGEEPSPCARRFRRCAVELELERAGHADAVLVHREALVRVGGRNAGRPSGSTRRRRTPSADRAQRGTRPASPRRRRRRRRLAEGCARIRLRVEAGDPQRHDGDRDSSGYWSRIPANVSSSARPSLNPGHTTSCPEPRCRGRAGRGASAGSSRRVGCAASRAHLGIGRVDADVQR